MARSKFGSLITDIRGSIGGHTFTKGSSGTFIRTKVKPRISSSSLAFLTRSLMQQLGFAWASLSSEDRQTWMDNYADYKFRNSLGNTYSVSPYNLFVALNRLPLQCGQAIRTSLDGYSLATNYNARIYLAGNRIFRLAVTSLPATEELFVIYVSQIFTASQRPANFKWKLLTYVCPVTNLSTVINELHTYVASPLITDGSQFAWKIVEVSDNPVCMVREYSDIIVLGE